MKNPDRMKEALEELDSKIDWEGGWDEAVFAYGINIPGFLFSCGVDPDDLPVELRVAYTVMVSAHETYEATKKMVQGELKNLAQSCGYDIRNYF